MVLATRHEHGALVRCLNVIADEGLNMTKLESRPRPACRGNTSSTSTSKGTSPSRGCRRRWPALAARTVFVKVLGCYPARELPR